MCENEIEFTLTRLKEAQPDCNNIDSLHFFSVKIKEAEIRPVGGVVARFRGLPRGPTGRVVTVYFTGYCWHP